MVDYILRLFNVTKKYWIQNIDRAKLRIKSQRYRNTKDKNLVLPKEYGRKWRLI